VGVNDGNTNTSTTNEAIIVNKDILRPCRSHSPTKTSMNRRVCHTLWEQVLIFKSDSCFEGVALRTIENFNTVHYKFTTSLKSCSFNVVRNKNLTTPGISVVTNDSHISAKQNNFCSHINTIIIVRCWTGLSPVIELKWISQSYLTSSRAVRFNHSVVNMMSWHSRRDDSYAIPLFPIKTSFNLDS